MVWRLYLLLFLGGDPSQTVQVNRGQTVPKVHHVVKLSLPEAGEMVSVAAQRRAKATCQSPRHRRRGYVEIQNSLS